MILTLSHPIRPCCPAMPYNKALINLVRFVICEKISERGLSCMELALRAGSVLWRPRSMIFSHITRFPILLERFRFDYEFNNNLFRIPTSPKCYEYNYEFAIFGANCWRNKVVVIVFFRTSFEENVVLKWAMTTTLSRQQEMTRAIGAKNDESRSRIRSQI